MPPDSKILVGITTVNGPERVFSVLRSLEASSPEIKRSTLIVDDGSSSSDADALDEVASVFDAEIVHFMDEKGRSVNRGISAGWNAIASMAISKEIDYALILNDDITVLPDAIGAALYVARSNEQIGTVGLPPYHRLPTGLVLEWPAGAPMDRPVRVPYSVGCSFLLSTKAWKEIKGFDEQYKSHFEDQDFGIRLNQAGWVTLHTPSGVLHDWSSTFKANPSLHGHLRLEVSRRKFLRKWKQPPESFGPYPSVRLNYLDPKGTPVTDTVEYFRR